MLPLARNRAARSIPAPAARSQRSSTRSLVCIRALYGKGEAMKSVGDGVWPCALAAYAKRFARAARARATLDAYASDLADFERFCALHGLAALPAAPQTVGRYVSVLATTGPAIPRLRRDRGGAAAVVRPAAVSTIRRRLEGELPKQYIADGCDSLTRSNGTRGTRNTPYKRSSIRPTLSLGVVG